MQIDVAPRRKRKLSLTPLIDVVFNLLLFFMLASSLARWSGVELATGSEHAKADETPAGEVHMSEAGTLRYQGETFTQLPVLAERLKGELHAGDISSVVLRAEDGVRLETLIEGFDTFSHAGIEALALGDTAP